MENQNPSGAQNATNAQNPSSAQNFFDDAARLFDKGISKARTVVSETTIEQRGFTRAFVRVCNDGWLQGWHESNGGNLSYRLTSEEVSSCRSFFKDTPGEWVALGIQADSLRGECFMVTGAGKHFRSVAFDPSENIGIVEINPAGDAWRLVWGLKGGRPTSELPTHLINHAVRKAVTADACRVVYHAHPANMIALTLLEQFDSRSLSRLLWKSVTECIIAIPDGVGVVGWMVPGGKDIALATSEAIETHASVAWTQHGVFTTGADFDAAFGLMHTLDKAAGIYLTARAAQGGKPVESRIADADLRALAAELNLPIKADYLD